MNPEYETADYQAGESAYPSRHGIVPVGGRYAAVHDRGLATTTALVAAVAVSRHLIGIGWDPLGEYAMGLYLGFGMVGYGAGAATPKEYRAALQAAAAATLALVGVGTLT